MAMTGLEVFDKTLHTTNLWLDEINAEIGPDRHLAWHVLGSVLRSIRDEMQVDQSAHFAAQLPLIIRGAYFDQYRPAVQPASDRSQEEFIARIQHDLDGSRPVNAEQAATAVMRILNRHVTEGQIKKVRDALPKGVRAMWPEPEGKSQQMKGGQTAKSAPAKSEPAKSEPSKSAAPQPKAAPQQSAPSHTEPKASAPPEPKASAPRLAGARSTAQPQSTQSHTEAKPAMRTAAPPPEPKPAPQQSTQGRSAPPPAPQQSASSESSKRPEQQTATQHSAPTTPPPRSKAPAEPAPHRGRSSVEELLDEIEEDLDLDFSGRGAMEAESAVFEEEEDVAPSRKPSSSGGTHHSPIGASSRPASVQAAPARSQNEQPPSEPRRPTRTKRT